MSRVIDSALIDQLTLQNAHDTHKDTIVQDVFINSVVVKKHLRGTKDR